jgi:Bacterial extracellular solute-binding protein
LPPCRRAPRKTGKKPRNRRRLCLVPHLRGDTGGDPIFPERIREDKSDVGIVWKTEVMEALRQRAQIEGGELPGSHSLRDEVSYTVGALENAGHRENADRYLAFLATKVAQETSAAGPAFTLNSR